MSPDHPEEARRPSLADLRAAALAGPPYEAAFLDALEADPRAGARAVSMTCIRRQAAVFTEQQRLLEMLRFEREAAAGGFSRVAGVDEAGRGPLAGPIVAGAVVLSHPIEGLDDSKRLTAEQRDRLFEVIHAEACDVGMAVVASEEIDRDGIQSSNYRAMKEAVEALHMTPDFLLVDGFSIQGCALPQMRIVKGDRRSLSIAAASIVAKVTRDRMMDELDAQYPQYGFAQHKGYGTRDHLEAIKRHGPCAVHRKSFAPIAEMRETGLLF
ncbi:MAG TPA: ribonuclease HII [Candidatus Hydrogenedentes bacterium]|nr:ribonuclease HII [Candidatus Hydrogenedentota bacterium]HPG66394.1 ribonuclease HII [Candidatus Hydrogenedentota bacterium]